MEEILEGLPGLPAATAIILLTARGRSPRRNNKDSILRDKNIASEIITTRQVEVKTFSGYFSFCPVIRKETLFVITAVGLMIFFKTFSKPYLSGRWFSLFNQKYRVAYTFALNGLFLTLLRLFRGR